MKKLLMILSLVFFLCFAFSCQKGEEVAEAPVVDVGADIAAIKALNDEWLALYNAGDFDKLVTIYYTENAVQMPPNLPILEGKEAILSSLKKSIEEMEEYCDRSIIEDVSVHGNVAVARGTDTGTITIKGGGESTRYDIKWLIVYERQSDGTWKCAYEIWNENNPLPSSPEEKQ